MTNTNRFIKLVYMETKRVGSFEAKTHFAELVDEASRGATIIITKRGRPAAQLGPCSGKDNSEVRDTVEKLKAIRGGIEGPVNIKALIREGRKF